MKFGEANKLLERIKKKYRGDQKAKKLLLWGKSFENNFEYELALCYYRDAFDVARQVTIKREAVALKLVCLNKLRNDESEKELIRIKKFLNEGSIDEYIDLTTLMDIFKKMPKLVYSEQDECTTFV